MFFYSMLEFKQYEYIIWFRMCVCVYSTRRICTSIYKQNFCFDRNNRNDIKIEYPVHKKKDKKPKEIRKKKYIYTTQRKSGF